MHANMQKQTPTATDLGTWQTELDFYGDEMLLDYGRVVMDSYMDANPGPKYTQAVTVIIDRDLTVVIPHVSPVDDANIRAAIESVL